MIVARKIRRNLNTQAKPPTDKKYHTFFFLGGGGACREVDMNLGTFWNGDSNQAISDHLPAMASPCINVFGNWSNHPCNFCRRAR